MATGGVATSAKSIFGFDPRTVPGCVLWLDAADTNTIATSSGTNISTWKDKSISATTATAVGTAVPTYSGGTVNFGGTGYFTVPAGVFPSGVTSYYGFVVVSGSFYPATGFAYNNIFFSKTASGGNMYALAIGYDGHIEQLVSGNANIGERTYGVINRNVNNLISFGYNQITYETYHNGINIVFSKPPTSLNATSGTSYIGSGFTGTIRTGTLNGTISEFIIYNNYLTKTQRESIEGYLAWKWGVNTSLPTSVKTITNPTSIANCVLWLDASDTTKVFSNSAGTTPATTGGTVAYWQDKSASGSNYNFSNTGGSTYCPVYTSAGLNGLNTLTFTAANKTYLVGPANALGSSSLTIFSVCKYVDTTSSGYIFAKSLYGAANGRVLFGRDGSTPGILRMGIVTTVNAYASPPDIYPANTWRILAMTTDRSVSAVTSVYNNGYLFNVAEDVNPVLYTADTGTVYNTSYPMIIGGYNDTGGGASMPPSTSTPAGGSPTSGLFLNGSIGEIIIYTSALTSTQRRQVELYLATKWNLGTSLIQHPYYSLVPYTKTFQPTDIPGCQLWLDAADTSSLSLTALVVNTWKDKSGNAYSGTSSGSPTLVTNSQNRLPCINFSAASSQYFNFGNIINLGSSGISIFIVGKTTFVGGTTQSFIAKSKFAGAAGRWGFIYYNSLLDFALDKDGVSSADTTYSATRYSGVFSLFECTWNLSNSITYAFGTQTATSSSPFSTSLSNTFPLYVGVYQDGGGATPLAGTYYNGTIGEILVYNSALTEGQRQQVEGYLANKWGIQSSVGGTTTTTFSYTGATQTYTVPAGVTSLNVSLSGGAGGCAAPWTLPGGAGGFLSGSLPVTSGQILTIIVGGGGGLGTSTVNGTGGYRGGGTGYFYTTNGWAGGGGGGWSGILDQAGTTAYCIAGAGGGSGSAQPGGGAGGDLIGASASSGAAGGTQSIGGLNSSGTRTSGLWSAATNGASSGTGTSVGGGGGGGYWGGGSGDSSGAVGGGGGGSSYIGTLTGTVVNTQGGGAAGVSSAAGGNGSITISYGQHPFSKIPPTSPSLFSPTNIGACAIWIDGNDPYGTGVVPASGATFATTSATIIDKSGNGYNLTPTATIYYSTQFLNNMGVLNFGTARAQNSSFNWTTNFTQFVVVKGDAGKWGVSYISTADAYWSYVYAANNALVWVGAALEIYNGTAGTSVFTKTGKGVNAWTIFCIGYTPGLTIASNYTLNGTSYTTTSTGGTNASFNSSQLTNLVLTLNGNRGGNYDDGVYVAEFIHYNATLTTNQRQQVEGYLAGKWGLQGLLPTTHPYYKSIPAAVSSFYFYESFENALVTSGAYPQGVYIVWNEWTSNAGSSVGISWVGSTWDAPGSLVINGTRYAFAQVSGSFISRVFQGPLGYTASLSFSISYRSAYSANPFSDGNFSVIVNWTPTSGVQISLGTFTVISTGWATYSTNFTFTASSGTLTFVNNCNTAAQQVAAAVAAGRTPNQSNYGANVSVAQTISSIAVSTPSTGFVTYTTSATHAITAGQVVLISGLTTAGFNGSYYVIAVTTNTFRVSNAIISGTFSGQSGTIVTIPGIGDNSIILDNILIT